jgi:hypothetical protein
LSTGAGGWSAVDGAGADVLGADVLAGADALVEVGTFQRSSSDDVDVSITSPAGETSKSSGGSTSDSDSNRSVLSHRPPRLFSSLPTSSPLP